MHSSMLESTYWKCRFSQKGRKLINIDQITQLERSHLLYVRIVCGGGRFQSIYWCSWWIGPHSWIRIECNYHPTQLLPLWISLVFYEKLTAKNGHARWGLQEVKHLRVSEDGREGKIDSHGMGAILERAWSRSCSMSFIRNRSAQPWRIHPGRPSSCLCLHLECFRHVGCHHPGYRCQARWAALWKRMEWRHHESSSKECGRLTWLASGSPNCWLAFWWGKNPWIGKEDRKKLQVLSKPPAANHPKH